MTLIKAFLERLVQTLRIEALALLEILHGQVFIDLDNLLDDALVRLVHR